VDLKETFQVCLGSETPDPEMIPPRWPSKPSSLRPALTRYYRELEKLASRLLKLFALALELPRDWFEDKVRNTLIPLCKTPRDERIPITPIYRLASNHHHHSITRPY